MIELKNSLTKTILMVTHDRKAAARAERILHLEKGQLVSETIPDDIAPASLPLHAHSTAGRAMNELDQALLHFMDDWRNPVGLAAVVALAFVTILFWEQSRFIARSLRRNILRSTLTGLATFVLVLVITLVWSALTFLDQQMEAKSRNLKAIVTEKYQSPSQMPYAYGGMISEGRRARKGLSHRPEQRRHALVVLYRHARAGQMSRESMYAFFFAMDPRKVLAVDEHGKWTSMMDDIDEVSEEPISRRSGRAERDGAESL